jgi:chaperonin GroEL (HSP60 family)
MWIDPIVEETRKIRDEQAARFDYEVRMLGEYYASEQQGEGRVVVRGPAKREARDLDRKRTLDDILEPFRQAVEKSGMSDDELDSLFTEARKEASKSKRERLLG